MPPLSKTKVVPPAPARALSSYRRVSWMVFTVFLAADSGLSYAPLSHGPRVWIFFAGLVLPFLLLARLLRQSPLPTGPLFSPALPTLPLAWGAVFFLLALALRLARLTTLSQWPLADEGVFGYFAVRLGEKWDGSLLQGLSQLPTLFTWLQALLFKIAGPSLAHLWLFPALWSILLVPAAWFTCRKFFDPSLSAIITGVAAFGFWPLFLGRFSTQASFMVFWECVEFWALGSFLRADEAKKNSRVLLLGIVTGIGFYTYLPWFSIACVTALAVGGNRAIKLPKRFFFLSILSLTAALIALPLLLALYRTRLDYLENLWSLRPGHPFGEHLGLLFGYGSDLFWGARHATFRYGPLWGGFLNPLLGSCFLFGWIVLPRFRSAAFAHWFWVSIPVLALPAFLSDNFEDMRIVQLIPLIAVITGLGIRFLVSTLPPLQKAFPLFLIFFVSASLDFHHLFIVYGRSWNERPHYFGIHKSPEFYRAYLLLKPLARTQGPGLLLLNFNPDPYDQTLFVATYAFNSAENPSLDPGQARWAAVLANVHEEPYLKKMFPGGKWSWLSQGLNRMDGGFLLEMVPVTPSNRALLERWTRADHSLKELTYLVMETGVDPDQSRMLGVLERAYPFFKGDPLLESRYWRIRAVHESAEPDISQAVEDEEKAIRLGRPMAHLYNEMGCLLFKEGKRALARKAFEETLRLKPNCTDAGENLNNLNLMMKEGDKTRSAPNTR